MENILNLSKKVCLILTLFITLSGHAKKASFYNVRTGVEKKISKLRTLKREQASVQKKPNTIVLYNFKNLERSIHKMVLYSDKRKSLIHKY
ncbi:hypothetical protein [Tamlana sp. I1]|uniref:hypothetical protein n=1 Tax=Tamlana sp. I1 TaxID=2762061 RepID=UPI00188FF1A1|nr:hypothetical protein [Tamlana sp. I1]